MKPYFALRPVALFALLSLASVGAVVAQTADPSATIAPSKPAAETATPSPGAAVNSLPATSGEKTKTKATPEERAARKKKRMEKFDTNKDGKLDAQERAAMRAARGGAPADTEKAKASPAL